MHYSFVDTDGAVVHVAGHSINEMLYSSFILSFRNIDVDNKATVIIMSAVKQA